MNFLIEEGASVNAKDKYELTALHHAAMRGNVSAIKRLLEDDGIEKEVFVPKRIRQNAGFLKGFFFPPTFQKAKRQCKEHPAPFGGHVQPRRRGQGASGTRCQSQVPRRGAANTSARGMSGGESGDCGIALDGGSGQVQQGLHKIGEKNQGQLSFPNPTV